MSLKTRERLTVGLCAVILIGWAIFWGFEVKSVLDLLEMAYG